MNVLHKNVPQDFLGVLFGSDRRAGCENARMRIFAFFL